ncbi:TetR family transcriptional regulator [Actinomycetospora flava]|uniref:TetR family transcriptional regulator n=1 Tax=Actinomycetospora flava TaxID=3129232 RepID=A0ABU8M4Z9_9PSEU
MPRWEHGSEERLTQAALDLFAEQGFEDTSVLQIADRARVTPRTFFRYFSDKREVLFAHADELRGELLRRVVEAPDVGDPLAVVVEALSGFDWGSRDREVQRRRQALIVANTELLERELVKNAAMAEDFAGALQRRGVGARSARLAARVGSQIFLVAYEEWLAADHGSADLAAVTDEVMASFRAVAPQARSVPGAGS